MSAPPHREVVSYNGTRRTTQVTLSPDERQIAKASGMSEVDYARNVLELERRKRAGLIQSDR